MRWASKRPRTGSKAPACYRCCTGLRDQLLDFLARRKHRGTVGDAAVAAATNNHKKAGVFYGQW